MLKRAGCKTIQSRSQILSNFGDLTLFIKMYVFKTLYLFCVGVFGVVYSLKLTFGKHLERIGKKLHTTHGKS